MTCALIALDCDPGHTYLDLSPLLCSPHGVSSGGSVHTVGWPHASPWRTEPVLVARRSTKIQVRVAASSFSQIIVALAAYALSGVRNEDEIDIEVQ